MLTRLDMVDIEAIADVLQEIADVLREAAYWSQRPYSSVRIGQERGLTMAADFLSALVAGVDFTAIKVARAELLALVKKSEK